MIFRIPPSQDTFITNFRKLGIPQTASNFGASEILNCFVIAPVSTSAGVASGSLARILMKFDLSEFVALTASHQAPSSMTYRLRLKNAPHDQTLPSSFDMEIFPLARNWDEGRGMDNDGFSDLGFANWSQARSNLPWSSPGGDYLSVSSSIIHFDVGDEDILADVTPIVNEWLSGTITNNGFMVRMSSSFESGSSDLFVKMFHSRQTHFLDRVPYLEASWDDSIKDDRNNFVFDDRGSLYLYNRIRGQLTDISAVGTGTLSVRVVDASGTVLQLTGSHVGLTGIYSASFTLPTGSYSGSVFNDIWYSGSRSFVTGTFYPSDAFAQLSQGQNVFFVNVTNLKSQYGQTEFPKLKLYVRNRDYAPAVVLTASSGPTGTVVTKAYYRVDNDRTDEVVVPFGTGSVETTRLSYDQDGNYFKFHMRSLPPRNVYRILFLFDVNGERQIIDQGFKFKVV